MVPQVGGLAVHVEDVEPQLLLLVEVEGEVEAALPLRVARVVHRLRPAHLRPVGSQAGLGQRGELVRVKHSHWSRSLQILSSHWLR